MIGTIQALTVNEYLPSIGIVLPAYTGHDPQTDASVLNEFAVAAMGYRLSQISSVTLKLATAGRCPLTEALADSVRTCDAFYESQSTRGSFEALLRGLMTQVSLLGCHECMM